MPCRVRIRIRIGLLFLHVVVLLLYEALCQVRDARRVVKIGSRAPASKESGLLAFRPTVHIAKKRRKSDWLHRIANESVPWVSFTGINTANPPEVSARSMRDVRGSH
jgi:hypothetical protein